MLVYVSCCAAALDWKCVNALLFWENRERLRGWGSEGWSKTFFLLKLGHCYIRFDLLCAKICLTKKNSGIV